MMRYGAILMTVLIGTACEDGHHGTASDAAPSQDAKADAGTDAQSDGSYVPTAAEIQFTAVNPLPAGEQFLFNDWNPEPNAVFSVTPDGQTVTEVFRAYRIWSLGASNATDRIAFACGDPDQLDHYGPLLNDAIQHTWIYDVATQTATLAANGNINDEGHAFAPDDGALYITRRYDFTTNATYRGYRVGRIDLPSLAFTFLTPDVDGEMDAWPRPTRDGTQLYFGHIHISGGAQTRSIMRLTLPSGAPELVRAGASLPAISPDGVHWAYQDWSDARHLYVANIDGTSTVKVSDHDGSNLTFSPDGTQLAFLFDASSANCSSIEVVKVDGSEASAPRRLRDCTQTGEQITQLGWITH